MINRKQGVCITVDWDIFKFLEGMPNRTKSKFVNSLIRKEIAIRKNPRVYIKEIQKERLQIAEKLSELSNKIQLIGEEYGISSDDIDSLQDIAIKEYELSKKDKSQEEQATLLN